ncbi:methyltransferase domain-containing protein [Pseudahrensia aquimaris]|uniref:Methyltransferase domain-containing protein n=1 Tax=Pseudahrensia aquimaris TaxID=744461 RepID=A0ABW3FFT3_9HYPH
MMVPSAYDATLAQKQAIVAASQDMRRQRQTMIEHLAPKAGEAILEVGCGNGDLTREIANLIGPNGTMVAVDPSSAMIEQASSAAPPARCIEASAVELPFEDNAFDAVIAAQVYCFVPDLKTAVAEAMRVLTPGGRLVILDSDWRSMRWTTGSEAAFARADRIVRAHYAHSDVPEQLPHLLADQGFGNIEQTVFTIENHRSDPDTYSASINDSVETALETVSKYPEYLLSEWQAARAEIIAAGKFHFRLDRIITKAVKT